MALKEHLINAVAAAAALGIGSLTFNTSLVAARHDERIKRVEDLGERIDGLRQDITRTETKIERLDARLEAEATR